MQISTESLRSWTANRKLVTLGLCFLALTLSLGSAFPAEATAERDFSRPGLLIGDDNDNEDNPLIQVPEAPGNQSLDNTDILLGGEGRDVLIGLLGSDVIDGGTGDDIMIGGPEAFVAPNKDIARGGSGNDIFIWAPGDGSDAFLGGEGDADVMLFGVIDRDEDGIPLLTATPARSRTGIPTAEVTNLPGFCRLETVDRGELGFEYLVRFFTRVDGVLRVTVRLSGVEQIFCASEAGGAITYADLTTRNPNFEEVSLEAARTINPLIGLIIR